MNQAKISLFISLFFFLFLNLFGCSTAQKKEQGRDFHLSAQELYDLTCKIGQEIQSVEGSLQIKTLSKEVNGQFPASVKAVSPDQLRLEVTNFLGGSEALIVVQQDRYEITGVRGKKEQKEEGFGSWGGIPLKWATRLFLGQIPCPGPSDPTKLKVTSDGDLQIDVAASQDIESQSFVFQYGKKSERVWPESLHWERKSNPPLVIDFKFDDPEKESFSPKKWEANSPRGQVKVRWRNREVTQIKKQ